MFLIRKKSKKISDIKDIQAKQSTPKQTQSVGVNISLLNDNGVQVDKDINLKPVDDKETTYILHKIMGYDASADLGVCTVVSAGYSYPIPEEDEAMAKVMCSLFQNLTGEKEFVIQRREKDLSRGIEFGFGYINNEDITSARERICKYHCGDRIKWIEFYLRKSYLQEHSQELEGFYDVSKHRFIIDDLSQIADACNIIVEYRCKK